MPSVELTPEQVISLVKQLSPHDKFQVLRDLNTDRQAWWDRQVEKGEEQLRRAAAERGLEWDRMNEDEREAFIDVLMHEDR